MEGIYSKVDRTSNTNHHLHKHGLGNHPLYHKWNDMIRRCYNPKRKDYKYYGGRGIKVWEYWKNNFLLFYYWALGEGWEGLELDRIDNNKGYHPNNCRFTTRSEQLRNRRPCKWRR